MTLLYPVKRKLKANSKPWFKKETIFLQKMLHGIMKNTEVCWFKFEGKEYVKTFAERRWCNSVGTSGKCKHNKVCSGTTKDY